MDEVINALRSDEYGLLKDRRSMVSFARAEPDSAFKGNYTTEYGFRVDTDNHAFLIRCNPQQGDYNFYCYCYVSKWLDQHIEKAAQDIRFIDSGYNELFRLPDGEKITVTLSSGEKLEETCRYIDEAHLEVGHSLYHICEFAERMERNGNTYCRLEDLDIEMMHYKPNNWALAPLFSNVLLESNRIPKDYDMSHFKLFGFGGEPMTKKYIKRVQKFLDEHNCTVPLSAGYGQSEGGTGFTVAMGKEMVLSGSSGYPYIDTTISIFKPNTTEELKYNEVGEICKSGPGIMLGYSDKTLTDEVLKIHPDGNLWLHTGDFGYMTEQGLLFVLGRERIQVSSDKFVFPLEIEDKIASVDGVKDAVIVSGKDNNGTEFRVPYLFIVPEKGMSESELLVKVNAFISTELSPEQKPKSVFIIEKKPISKFKVDRKALQQKFNLI